MGLSFEVILILIIVIVVMIDKFSKKINHSSYLTKSKKKSSKKTPNINQFFLFFKKHINYSILLVVIFTCSYLVYISYPFSTYSSSDIVYNNKLAYFKNNMELVNGVINDSMNKGEIIKGKKEGVWMNWHKNGQLKKMGQYKNNKQIGLWEYWYENGQLHARGLYKNGNESNLGNSGIPRNGRSGTWEIWDKEGRKRYKGYYINGKRNGSWKEWRWSEFFGGGIREISLYKNGIKYGLSKTFHFNGNIKSLGYYENGKQYGNWSYWWRNGNLLAKGNYFYGDGTNKGSTGVPKNGREGNWLFWHSNGKLDYKGNYSNGTLKGESNFWDEKGRYLGKRFF